MHVDVVKMPGLILKIWHADVKVSNLKLCRQPFRCDILEINRPTNRFVNVCSETLEREREEAAERDPRGETAPGVRRCEWTKRGRCGNEEAKWGRGSGEAAKWHRRNSADRHEQQPRAASVASLSIELYQR